MFRESKIEKRLYCVLIVYRASDAYKNDMEGDSVVSVLRFRLELCDEIFALFTCSLQCWVRICVGAKFEFNQANVSVSVWNLFGIWVLSSFRKACNKYTIWAALVARRSVLLVGEPPVWMSSGLAAFSFVTRAWFRYPQTDYRN